MSELRTNASAGALLISPDAPLTAELTGALAQELPGLPVHGLRTYPGRAALDGAGRQAQLCFLDVGSDRAAAFATLALLGSTCPGLPVIALLRANDPDLILSCLRQGALEFLILPFTAEQLRGALAKLSRFRPVKAPVQGQGRVYCLMPVKGACGASTLASNLAPALKRLRGHKALLADLDGLTGTLAFLLKLKSNYSFVDALTHASSLDADLWKALILPFSGVDVLLSPDTPVHGLEDNSDPGPLLAYTRQAYETVLLDAGGVYGAWNLALARLADELLLVTTNELPALHAAQRALIYLEDNGVERSKIRLLANRYGDQVGLCRQDIEAALRAEVFETLPSDYEGVQKALLEGKPVPASSRLGKSVVTLAGRLCGEEPAARKSTSLFGGLFARK